jgi:hypothetical protein
MARILLSFLQSLILRLTHVVHHILQASLASWNAGAFTPFVAWAPAARPKSRYHVYTTTVLLKV